MSGLIELDLTEDPRFYANLLDAMRARLLQSNAREFGVPAPHFIHKT